MEKNDLFLKIESLLTVVQQQSEDINELKQVVKKQEEVIKVQNQEITDLREEITILKKGKNSKNSSNPPSTDFSANKSLRQSTGKNSGGQPGHKGHTLEFSSHPDHVIAHVSRFCRKCGDNLEHLQGKLVDKRQVVDIPPCAPIVSQHQIFAKQCKCGEENIADFPSHLKASIQYGSSVESLVAYLSVRQYMPYKRIAEFISHYYNLTLSEGTITNLLNRFARKANLPYQQIKATLSRSPVVGSDETGVKVNGAKAWMHTWQDNSNTYIACAPSRSSKAIEDQFPDGFPNSILISDAWAAQLKTPAKGHQLCIAHLQRELNHFTEDIKNPWAEKIRDLFNDALKPTKDKGALLFETFNQKIIAFLNEDQQLPKKIQAFRKRLIKNKDSISDFSWIPQSLPTTMDLKGL